MKPGYFSRPFFLTLITAVILCQSLHARAIFQYSTLGALSKGLFDGGLTCRDLSLRGNFGLGTFDRLDGEMVVVDGDVFKVRSDGKVIKAKGEETTPFAEIVYFVPDKDQRVSSLQGIKRVSSFVDSLLPSRNILYAVKISGMFSNVLARSVPVQSKPYTSLADAVKAQSTFEAADIEGSLIGFRYPEYMSGINLPGYHFHFISKDRRFGGHVLDCSINSADIQICTAHDIQLRLPSSKEFGSSDLEIPGSSYSFEQK